MSFYNNERFCGQLLVLSDSIYNQENKDETPFDKDLFIVDDDGNYLIDGDGDFLISKP